MVAWNSFIFGGESLAGIGLAQHRRKAETVVHGAFLGDDGTVAAQNSGHDGTTFFRFAFEELHEVGEGGVTKNEAIFVVSVQLGRGVALHMLWQANRLQGAHIFGVLGKEEILVDFEELLGILGVEGGDHVQERVDEKGPQNAAEFRL